MSAIGEFDKSQCQLLNVGGFSKDASKRFIVTKRVQIASNLYYQSPV